MIDFMANEFYIQKQSGTYSELLEAYGLANLINEILLRTNRQGYKITIKDKQHSYLVKTNIDLTDALIQNLNYFQIIKFIKKDTLTKIPPDIEFFDYPENKAAFDNYKKLFKEIESDKNKSVEEKKQARKLLIMQKESEFGTKIDTEFDVYREIKLNPYVSFTKLHENFHQNQNNFSLLVGAILSYYSSQSIPELGFSLSEKKPTAQQLYNPNQGKGLNKGKANNASMSNIDGFWISETMKISGALSFMVCQYVKSGSSYDLKIYVPEFNEISLSEGKRLILNFKKYLRSASPLKLDVLNSLNFTIKFIQLTPEYTGKVVKTLHGLHSVYQKDLGQNKAVANISFIRTPDFVSYNNQAEGQEWLEILEDQRNLISSIKEQGDAIQGLQEYRNFLGSSGASALKYFTAFSFWYAIYLMQQLAKNNTYIRTFKIEYLTKFYKNMNTKELNITEIINNEGFQAIAKAIRKSTVTLQYTPKEHRKFEIRYGLAQQLQNKSKSKNDLATFIGEFISTYNAETSRNAEKNGGQASRANVKDDDLNKFYSLLESNSPRLVGALLASYGFALNKKETQINEEIDEEGVDQEEN